MSELISLLNRRQSCREFSQRPVEDKKLVACIAAARLAPSAMNAQPWHFTVVNDPENAKAAAELTQLGKFNRFTKDCPAFIIVQQTPGKKLANTFANLRHQDFRSIDIGLAVGALCLEAVEQGLDTCILGIFDEEKLKQRFQLPSANRVRLVIAIGYAVDGYPLREKKRRELEEIISYVK